MLGQLPETRYKRAGDDHCTTMTALWRWVLLRLLQSPLIGLLLLVLVAGPLLVRSLRPSPSSATDLGLFLIWTYPAGLIGVVFGLATLSHGDVFLRRLDPRTRWGGELGALLAAGLYLQLPILVAALLSGVPPSDLARAVPVILTSALQLASVALLLLYPALSTALRTSLFLSAVWFVPALVAGNAPLGRAAALLDAGAVLRPVAVDALPRALVASAALALAGYLLRTASGRASTT